MWAGLAPPELVAVVFSPAARRREDARWVGGSRARLAPLRACPPRDARASVRVRAISEARPIWFPKWGHHWGGSAAFCGGRKAHENPPECGWQVDKPTEGLLRRLNPTGQRKPTPLNYPTPEFPHRPWSCPTPLSEPTVPRATTYQEGSIDAPIEGSLTTQPYRSGGRPPP